MSLQPNGEANDVAQATTERRLARRKPGQSASALADVKFGYTRDQVELIKRTVAKGATDDELQLFLIHSQRTGLDPFSRQIHFIKRWDSREQKEVGAIQTAIDGMRLIASRTGRYRPDDETPRYTYKDGSLIAAEVRVYVFHELSKLWFSAPSEARFDEYAQKTRDGKLFPNWQRMPHLMLAKCAEALALRKAFPAELSGIYSEEEVDVIAEGTVSAPRELPRSEQQSEIPPAPVAPPEGMKDQPRAATTPKAGGPVSTSDQHTAIHRLAKGKHKLSDEQLDAWLKFTFGVTSTTQLSFQQASEAIGYLQATPTEAILRVVPASGSGPQQQSLVG